MKVDVVVDAGNSFIKWGRCAGGKVVEIVYLKLADTEGWNRQRDDWALKTNCQWIITGSNPAPQDLLETWLKQQEQSVHILNWHVQLPIVLSVKHAEQVGLDRLFNAVAVNSRRPKGRAALVIDAGTAVTVDYVDEAGVFQGGAILPGSGIMADVLHIETTALPLINLGELGQLINKMTYPGKATKEAMALGIDACFLGGIERCVRDFVKTIGKPPMFFIGGGDGKRVASGLALGDQHFWPEMTLEGIRIAAERLAWI